MKKALCLILMIALLIPAAAGLCDTTEFPTSLTPILVSGNTTEILSDSMNRSFLTICLWLDLAISKEPEFMGANIVNLITNDSYISSDGQYIALLGYSNGKYLNVYYNPRTQQADYSIMEGASDSVMAMVVKDVAETMPYNYKNDAAELTAVFQVIMEALQGE